MLLLLISPNPLFEELILDLITRHEGIDVISESAYRAHKQISQSKPDVIILDSTIDEKILDKILNVARSLKITRILLVDPRSNDFVILDSRRLKLRKADDLIQAVRGLDIAHI